MFSRSAFFPALAVACVLAAVLLVSAGCSRAKGRFEGSYEIDRQAFWAMLAPDLERNNPDILEAMRANVESLRFDLELLADGTFTTSSIMSTVDLPEGTEGAIDSSGTWTSSGDVLTLVVTTTRGISVNGTMSGRLSDGLLRLEIGQGQTVLLRKRGGA